jgi:serine/threonine protein phosphatase 1
MGRYAIGDIHGCANSFTDLLMKIGVSKKDELFLLGDYVDRGPSSKQVFDRIFELSELGCRVKCLRGNHEEMMLKAIDLPEENLRLWQIWGGKETMASFKKDLPGDIDKKYLDFIRKLPYWISLVDYMLVHASFNFKKEDFLEDKEAMIFLRSHSHDPDRLGSRRILHGHTPISKEDLLAQFKGKPPMVINLDGGCVYKGRKEGFGNLFALNMEKLEPIWVANSDF